MGKRKRKSRCGKEKETEGLVPTVILFHMFLCLVVPETRAALSTIPIARSSNQHRLPCSHPLHCAPGPAQNTWGCRLKQAQPHLLENSRGKKKKTVYVSENFWDDRFTSTCCKTQPTINGLPTAKPSHDYMQHW